MPFIVLASLESSLAFARDITASMIPEFFRSFSIFSEISHLEPNWETFVVRLSFVWVSKAGFSMRQLQKIHMWDFIWWGLICIFLDFFLIVSIRPLTI